MISQLFDLHVLYLLSFPLFDLHILKSVKLHQCEAASQYSKIRRIVLNLV